MPSLLHGQAEAGGHRRPRRALRAPLRQARRQEEELSQTDRSALFEAKLRAAVASRWGDGGDVAPFPHGAALRRATTGWVLAEEQAERALGPALIWARREGVTDLHVLAVEDAAGGLARRAAAFAQPAMVWAVGRGEVVEAQADPPAAEPALDPEVLGFRDVIAAAGADAVIEHGVLAAEVLGLEVGRVVVGDQGPRFEVGVGKHDRWAQLEVHGDVAPVLERLRASADIVRTERIPGGMHPLARLAPERWLRRVVMARPEAVGATDLEAAPAPVARPGLRGRAPAPAVGTDTDGRPVVVVCSVGIDVDLVPAAADARLSAGPPDARLLIVVPEGDDHPVTRDLAAALRHPAEVLTLGAEWRGLYP